MPSTRSEAPLWALVDCNCFYCSCERLFRPDLADRPVVVLSNNDGCLIALSPEAKALGFTMGEVYFQARPRLERTKTAVFSSNYTLYGDISSRVMRALGTLAPLEPYSIDEAFAYLSSSRARNAEALGWAMRDRVRQWVGMPTRVGIGQTKTLAKLANYWAKRTSPVLLLRVGSRELEDILEQTAVVEIWGIGRGQAERLKRRGIRNARQLRDLDPDRALKILTVVGQRTVLELRGFPCILENSAPVSRKSLINSRSFGRSVTRKEDLAEALAMHCAIAGERLRAENLEASTLCVHIKTSRHAQKPYFSAGAAVILPFPTNLTDELIKAAKEALDKCYEPGHKYMKGGICLYDIVDANMRQLTLLEACSEPLRKNKAKLMQAMDRINGKFGRDTVRYLAQGASGAFWHMQRNKMSPAFTTRWEDLPKAKL